MIIHNALELPPIDDEVNLESFNDFFNFLSNFIGEVKTTLNKLLNNHIDGTLVTPEGYKTFSSLIESRHLSYRDFKGMMIFRPALMTGNQMDFNVALAKQLSQVATIEKDLVQPMLELTGYFINNPDKVGNMVSKGNFHEVDLDPMVKELKSFYNPRMNKRDQPEDLMVFGDAFLSFNQVKKMYDALVDASKTAASIDLKSLRAKENTLAGHIDVLIEMEKDQTDPESKFTLPEQTRNLIREYLIAAAKETEYLSHLLYTLAQSVSAWNDNLEKFDVATQPEEETK